MPATVIAERIGWTRGLTVLRERVAELRPVYLPPDAASRTTPAPRRRPEPVRRSAAFGYRGQRVDESRVSASPRAAS